MHEKFTKTMGRMGFFLLIAITIALTFALPASAAESIVTTAATAEGAPQSDAPNAAELPLQVETVAGAIADFLREESAGLLSGATLLFTLIVSLGFRKRVIPSLLEALATLIGKSREAVGAITEGREAEHAELTALLERVETMLDEARAATTAAEEAAAALILDGRLKAVVETALTEQSSLLYELLMSANLPQYQKDRIGAQHARVTAALSVDGHE